jgi:hypothetical protein
MTRLRQANAQLFACRIIATSTIHIHSKIVSVSVAPSSDDVQTCAFRVKSGTGRNFRD